MSLGRHSGLTSLQLLKTAGVTSNDLFSPTQCASITAEVPSDHLATGIMNVVTGSGSPCEADIGE
jgi:hypothetical protein